MGAESNSANGAMLSPHATQIEVGSGRYVDVYRPDPATLDLEDIGRALSHVCRYGGHVKRFYSVAEHSILVHDLMRWQGADDDALRGALFHDAAEAYLGDVPAPLKYALRHQELVRAGGFADGTADELERWWAAWRSSYDDLTERMEHAISERFGALVESMNSPELKLADMWALKIEAAQLTFSGGAEWRWTGELPNGGVLPDGVAWYAGRTPEIACRWWLRLAARLSSREGSGDAT